MSQSSTLFIGMDVHKDYSAGVHGAGAYRPDHIYLGPLRTPQ